MFTKHIAQVSEPVDPGGIEPSAWPKNPRDLTHRKLSISEGAEVVQGAKTEHHIETCCLEMGQMSRRSLLAIEDLLALSRRVTAVSNRRSETSTR
jgi:hypothetical protein